MAYETLALLNLKKSNSLEALSALAKASASVQVGKLSEAIELYKNIIGTAKWKFIHPEARFQLSLALIENKNEAEAIENLKTIQIEYPKQRKTVEESTKIMRWLKYKKNEGDKN
jgi:tetratricopeptide (TPR) repeat protein